MRGINNIGMEDGKRIIYQTGNKINLAIKEGNHGGVMKTRKVKSIEFIPIDELENNELLEKDIIYLDGKMDFQRGIVIGRIGAMLFVRKKELFDNVDLDRKEKIPIEYVVGVVKENDGS